MHKFEYDIRLNDLGAPYIHIPDEYKAGPEDNFMFLEMARYVLVDIMNKVNTRRAKKKKTISDEDVKKIAEAYGTITVLSDEVALLYKATKEIEDELGDFLNKEE